MAGAHPTHTDPENSLAEGSKATHITPETGDTARATMHEDSSAGTHGSAPSPPEASGIGDTTRPVEKLDGEGRSFEGEGAAEALKGATDGKSGH